MRTAIDASGRLVVPKPLREALGLKPGQPLDVSIRDGHLEIARVPVAVHLELENDRLVAIAERPMPVLNTAAVRDVLENVRR
jgi:AbrB family looped-hinge helix DNA binding protein